MNLKKKLIIGSLLGLTALGTIGGSEGYPPFYAVKTGTSVGINVGFVTDFQSGSKHYGMSIGAISLLKEGSTINGFNINVFNFSDGKVNGVSVGLANLSGDGENPRTKPSQAGETNGLEVGLLNYKTRFRTYYPSDSLPYVNGIQVGLINAGRGDALWQVGLWNYNTSVDETKSRGVPIVNWRFD